MGGTTSLLTPLINYETLVLCARLKKCQLMKGVYTAPLCFSHSARVSPKDKFGSLTRLPSPLCM